MTTFQKTIAGSVTCAGVGVHSGQKARLIIHPAASDHGIKFRRTDRIDDETRFLGDAACSERDIAACARLVSGRVLGTSLSNTYGDSVATVEHLMAACLGMGLDNLLIEIDGPEVPIMDGSARVFCELFAASGIVEQDIPRRIIRIVEPVEVRDGHKWARLSPCVSHGLSLNARIDFDNAAIGMQEASLRLNSGTFDEDIGFARTFGFSKDIEALQAKGFARGGSLENAILIKGDQVVNPEGLRSQDEFVKHKLLDAVGDLSLAGGHIAGHYEADCPGHALNHALVLKLLNTEQAWRWETLQDTPPVSQGAAYPELQARI